MVRFGLQPHHLQANVVFHLSCLVTLAEGYLGLWPTMDLWAKFYGFRAVTLPGQDDDPKKENALMQCSAAMI